MDETGCTAEFRCAVQPVSGERVPTSFENKIMSQAPFKFDDWWQSLDQVERNRLEIGRQVAERIAHDLRQAQGALSMLEGLYERVSTTRFLRHMLLDDQANGLRIITDALWTNVVMATCRIIDHPQDDESYSACRIAPMLYVDEHVDALTSEHWLAHTRLFRTQLPRLVAEQRERIEWLKSVVPSGWGRGAFPPDRSDLVEARECVRDVRTRVLAHSLDTRELKLPPIQEIRSAVGTVARVADAVSRIYIGIHAPSHLDQMERRAGPDSFWDSVERGLSASEG
jgi:hypothetical protein